MSSINASPSWFGFFKKNRILRTRIVCAVFVALYLFSGRHWEEGSYFELAMETAGFIFLAISAFGRVWAAIYVEGYKTSCLVTDGPYSVVRNPLYVFSFIGLIGVGFAGESLTLLAVMCLLFLLYYPGVVFAEEEKLKLRHEEAFREYSKTTPRFIPNLSRLHEPETYQVNVLKLRRSIRDAMFFMSIFWILHVIESLQLKGILPVYFKLY